MSLTVLAPARVQSCGADTTVLVNSPGLMNRYSFHNFYCCTPQMNDCQADAKVQVPFE